MVIGSLQVELFLPATFSLKEKRFIFKSIKTKIHNQFNVSVAEVAFNDKWQKTCLGIVCVSNNRRFTDEILSKVLNMISKDNRIEILDQHLELF